MLSKKLRAITTKKTYIRFQKQNRKEKEEETEHNRPINLPQGNNIVHILLVHNLTLNFIIHKYIYIHTYIHTYIL